MKYANGKMQSCLQKSFSVRSQAHSYGSGEFIVYDNIIYSSNENDDRLYSLTECDGMPIPLTPKGDFRYADCSIDAKHKASFCVREEFFKNKQSEDSIIRLDLTSHEISVVVKGNDFYSNSIVSADGKHLAWLTWNLPHMVFDESQLWMADINQKGQLENSKRS